MLTTVNGYTINYEQLGSGPDLLMLHGWGYDLTLLMPLARALASSFRITLADMPGHGLSPEPKEAITVFDYAELVYGLLQTLSIESTYLLGHSFGCRLAIILAAKHPEKIKKMVLCGAAGVLPKRSAAYYLKVYRYKIGKFFIKTFAKGKLEKWQQSKGSEDYQKLSPVMKASFSAIVNQDLTPLLKDIQAPVFLIWGEKDTATPLYMAQVMEQEIPDCAKVVYSGRTHYAFLEESARTLAIVNTFFKE